MGWTVEMVEDLKKMWAEGLTTGEIGKKLGVSKNSIVGKVHRLGLSGRPSPIKKKDEEETAAPAPKAKSEKPAAKPAPKAKPAAVPAEPVKTEKPAAVQHQEVKRPQVCGAPQTSHHKEGKAALTDLDNHTCRWPIGDPKDENFHFCGRKIKIGQTYCDEHANIAYVKTAKK